MYNDKLVLDVKELQKQLGISRSLAYELVRRADFPCLKIGKRILVPFEELKNWMSQNSLAEEFGTAKSNRVFN